MAQYLISVWHDDDYSDEMDFDDPDLQRRHAKVLALNEEMAANGTLALL